LLLLIGAESLFISPLHAHPDGIRFVFSCLAVGVSFSLPPLPLVASLLAVGGGQQKINK
jgi:hypothetical protein